MIQEILGYLLTRSLLVNSSSDEIVESINNKEEFTYLLNNISSLIEEEDFLIVDTDMQDKVSDLIQKYRFEYNKDKEVNETMNYIIGRLHNYKTMDDERKKYIVNNWIETEIKNRELPKQLHNIHDIFYFISLDCSYFMGIMSLSRMEIKSVCEYSSLINLIINKYPEAFEEDKMLLGVINETLMNFKNIPLLRSYEKKMVKNTLSKIDSTYDMSECPDLEISFSLIKKKTKK